MWGSGGVGSCILNSILDRGRGRFHAVACLTPRKERAYSLDRNLCELQTLWTPEEEKTLWPRRVSNPDSPTIQPVARSKKVRFFVNTPWRNIEGVNLLIRNIGTRLRWMVSLTLRPIYRRRKSFRYLLNKRLYWLQSRCGHFDGLQNLLHLPGIGSLLSSS